MPLVNPSLGDMLATVPQLFASCVPDNAQKLHTVKLLRLVSKDMGSAVMNAVASCSVQLGEKACLNPDQLVKLMGNLLLKKLVVTVVMTSGVTGLQDEISQVRIPTMGMDISVQSQASCRA